MVLGFPAALSRLKTAHLFLFLFVYNGLLFCVSQIPGQTLSALGVDVWDKGAHMLLFFPVGILVGTLVTRQGRVTRSVSRFFIASAIVVLLGLFDEFHQSFVPGRFESPSDVIADALGGGLGITVAFFVGRRSK